MQAFINRNNTYINLYELNETYMKLFALSLGILADFLYLCIIKQIIQSICKTTTTNHPFSIPS